jgi:hypothetical protein
MAAGKVAIRRERYLLLVAPERLAEDDIPLGKNCIAVPVFMTARRWYVRAIDCAELEPARTAPAKGF